MKLSKLLFPLLTLSIGLTMANANEGWSTEFNTALAEAKQAQKPILVNFTGSDWCGWCIRLDEEVFSQDAFKEFANAELILVEADFPRRKEQPEAIIAQNESLLEKYGVRGFPTILLLSPDGDVVSETGYLPGGAETYVAHLEELLGM